MHTVFNRIKAFLAGLKTSWRAQSGIFSSQGNIYKYTIECLSLILSTVSLRFKYFSFHEKN